MRYKTFQQVRKQLKHEHRHSNWRAVGALHGIEGIMAWRIVEEGHEPTRQDIRAKLGLSLSIQVTTCPDCGKVHLKKSCPAKRHQRTVTSLLDLPDKELRYMLEHREEVHNDQ